MYRISKDFTFSASHLLNGLPDGHPCGRMHGHNYTVRVVLEAPVLGSVGFVRDYGDLKIVKAWIDATLDHRHLNDVWPGDQPSAEIIAYRIYERFKTELPELAAIAVSETGKTWAEYRP